MERFRQGDIVIVNFPYSNNQDSKIRPALIVADPPGKDYILAQITTQQQDIILQQHDFQRGRLRVSSSIKYYKLFTMEASQIHFKVAELTPDKLDEILISIKSLFNR